MQTDALSFLEYNKNLKEYNSFGVSFSAHYYASVENYEQLSELLNQIDLPENKILPLGGGSNMLFIGDYDGLLIHNAFTGTEIIDEDNKQVTVKIGGGKNWHQFVSDCVDQGWGNVENLALIPGTVGAAPIQNIGAYGVELEDVFISLHAFNLKTLKVETFDKEDCRFGYRDSIFKHQYKQKYLITEVTLQLTKKARPNTAYRSLANYLSNQGIKEPGIQDVFRAVVEIRQSKLPEPSKLGNAGSFFKNPVISSSRYQALQSDYPDIPGYEVDTDHVKVPAAWLIDQAGWRGKRNGQVGTYPHQALVIVNYGGATGAEILDFASGIRSSVYDNFDIKLEPEVNIITSGDTNWKSLLTE